MKFFQEKDYSDVQIKTFSLCKISLSFFMSFNIDVHPLSLSAFVCLLSNEIHSFLLKKEKQKVEIKRRKILFVFCLRLVL